MWPRWNRPPDDEEIEDLGILICQDDALPRFEPALACAPSAPPRRPYDPELALRRRAEAPVLGTWLILSCLFYTPGAWVLWALGLIAINCWLRPAYRQARLEWLFRVYVAAGAGQIAFALIALFNLSGLAGPLVGYAFGLLLLWIGLELRYQIVMPTDLPQTEEDRLYYYYS
jgi:hypothetical protein